MKPDAFVPHPYAELSVFRVSELGERRIWQIGEQIAEPQGKALYARAEILAGEVIALGLQVVPKEPPPHHANIVGWDRDDRASQRLVAALLASQAQLILRPDDIPTAL
ncbi:MAG: hypothetical protein L0Z50_19425 [Verrucomicrobiales bacterium]|nr:hypothetical protein [Verrucomicrobiales bacterium]